RCALSRAALAQFNAQLPIRSKVPAYDGLPNSCLDEYHSNEVAGLYNIGSVFGARREKRRKSVRVRVAYPLLCKLRPYRVLAKRRENFFQPSIGQSRPHRKRC